MQNFAAVGVRISCIWNLIIVPRYHPPLHWILTSSDQHSRLGASFVDLLVGKVCYCLIYHLILIPLWITSVRQFHYFHRQITASVAEYNFLPVVSACKCHIGLFANSVCSQHHHYPESRWCQCHSIALRFNFLPIVCAYDRILWKGLDIHYRLLHRSEIQNSTAADAVFQVRSTDRLTLCF